jgi:hypothetical protein
LSGYFFNGLYGISRRQVSIRALRKSKRAGKSDKQRLFLFLSIKGVKAFADVFILSLRSAVIPANAGIPFFLGMLKQVQHDDTKT